MDLSKYLGLDKHDEDTVEAMETTCPTLERVFCDGEIDLSHVWSSFEEECHLSEEGWDRLFERMIDVEAETAKAQLTSAFQSCTLHGLVISDTPVPKGRAVPVGEFTRWLNRKRLLSTKTARRQFFRDARTHQQPKPPSHKVLRQLPLGKHLIGSTFQEDQEDPFAPFSDADEIRRELGLPAPNHPKDRELILLVYELPEGTKVRYPTLADAYAAEDSWNPQFQCSKPSDEWGYTTGNQPEVVHEVIQGRCLVDPDGEGYSVLAVRTLR